MFSSKEYLNVEKLSPLLELLTKLVAGGIALCYISGVIIHIFHFAKFGLFDTSFLKLRYFISGSLFCGPVVLISASLFASSKMFSRVETDLSSMIGAKRGRTFKSVAAKVISAVMMVLFFIGTVLVIPLIASMFIFDNDLALLGTATFWKITAIYITIALLHLGSIWTLLSLNVKKSEIKNMANEAHIRPLSLSPAYLAWSVSMLTVFLASIVLFSYSSYRLIPYQFGGGAPMHVQFILKSGEETHLYPQASKSEERMSIPYRLLLSEGDTYTFLADSIDVNVVRISKDIVYGYRIVPDGKAP